MTGSMPSTPAARMRSTSALVNVAQHDGAEAAQLGRDHLGLGPRPDHRARVRVELAELPEPRRRARRGPAASGSSGGQPCGERLELGGDLLREGVEQLLLVGEVQVEGAVRGRRDLHDVVDPCRVHTPRGEHPAAGVEEPLPGREAPGPQLRRGAAASERRAAHRARLPACLTPVSGIGGSAPLEPGYSPAVPSYAELQVGDAAPPLVVENLSRTQFVKYAGRVGRLQPDAPRRHDRDPGRQPVGVRPRHAHRWGSWPASSRTGSVPRRSAGSRCASPSRCGRATCSRARRSSPASAKRAASSSSTSS